MNIREIEVSKISIGFDSLIPKMKNLPKEKSKYFTPKWRDFTKLSTVKMQDKEEIYMHHSASRNVVEFLTGQHIE